jgi:hypothetical protein
MFCAGDAVAKDRVDFVQYATGLITARKVFTPVTVSARAFNQISYFEIKPVVRSTGRGMSSCFVTVSLYISTRTVC